MPRVTPKVCAICGKEETTGWNSHWKRKHRNDSIKELLSKSPYVPWCNNWFNFLSLDMKTKYNHLNP